VAFGEFGELLGQLPLQLLATEHSSQVPVHGFLQWDQHSHAFHLVMIPVVCVCVCARARVQEIVCMLIPRKKKLLILALNMVSFGAFWMVFFTVQLPVLHAKPV